MGRIPRGRMELHIKRVKLMTRSRLIQIQQEIRGIQLLNSSIEDDPSDPIGQILLGRNNQRLDELESELKTAIRKKFRIVSGGRK